MLESAAQLYQDAVEAIHRVRVPASAKAHHGYLLEAAGALGTALTAARRGTLVDPVLVPLRSAYAQLESASRQLPGFPMVAFDQACCGRKA
jgi:hypothetical protein